MVGPKKTSAAQLQTYEKWYETWNKQRMEVIGYKMETSDLYPLTFIHIVKDIDRVWWQNRFESVRDNYKSYTMEALASSLRATLTELHQSVTSTPLSHSAFAMSEPTLQGQNQNGQSQSQRKQSGNNSKTSGSNSLTQQSGNDSKEKSLEQTSNGPYALCPCKRRKHCWYRCWDILPDIYPEDYIPTTKGIKNVKLVMEKDPKLRV
ncbi:hypothetical protein N7540_011553 [Penicillium herquei]|nr:hypothetical protein N7540_011553 [Penicillium herquei]